MLPQILGARQLTGEPERGWKIGGGKYAGQQLHLQLYNRELEHWPVVKTLLEMLAPRASLRLPDLWRRRHGHSH